MPPVSLKQPRLTHAVVDVAWVEVVVALLDLVVAVTDVIVAAPVVPMIFVLDVMVEDNELEEVVPGIVDSVPFS